MFKKGDVVVSNNLSNSNNGFIFKILLIENGEYYVKIDKKSKMIKNCFRKATDDEIKWFEAGITNINQIPEVSNNFWYLNEIKAISTVNSGSVFCDKDWTNFSYKEFLQIQKDINIHNKPPVKSQHVGNKVPINTPFEISDLKNCKIGDLTPEDHKIIQPWLYNLDYNWSATTLNVLHDKAYSLCTTGDNYLFKKSNILDFNALNRTEIKKETILNYIKQLNINTDEQINKKTTIKPKSRAIRGTSIRIPAISGRIASASRLIGNKASGKCIKSTIRVLKIRATVINC